MKIEFIPSDDTVKELVPKPTPAMDVAPNWYRDTKSGLNNPTFRDDGTMRKSFKVCMPFKDALGFGYIQCSWTDIYIDATEHYVYFAFSSGPAPIKARDTPVALPVSIRLHPQEMAFISPWIPRLPKGHSALLTTPLNRLDLPFQVSSGVVDADRFFHSPMGSVPVYFERGFKGTLPAGTPLFQIIPFKRQSWTSRAVAYQAITQRKRVNEIARRFTGAYRDNFWQPKKFS